MNQKNQRLLFPGNHDNAFGFRGAWAYGIRRLVQYIEDEAATEQWVKRRLSIYNRKPTVQPD